MTAKLSSTVAIVGAGPVGLFTALLVAQAGVKVVVLEAQSGIDQSPRAVAYFPSVLEEFVKAGILDDVIDAGEKNNDGCDWKDGTANILAKIEPPPGSTDFAVCLSQPEFCSIVLKRLLETGNAEVHFNHAFESLQQKDDSVSYWVQDKDGNRLLEGVCQYLVGADGGRSTVRRVVKVELQGYTWDSLQFVAVNFQYPLSQFGWKAATFIVDPVNWGIVVKRGKGNSWRFATGVPKSTGERLETLDQATIDVVKERLSRLLPGDTSGVVYEALAPYTVHQRCASSYRVGNVLLAGDAAHLNNPVGGLGLTTGLLDAAHLAKALQQILVEGANDDVLNIYAEVRRMTFRERTDPITSTNLRRLWSKDPSDVKKRDELFARLNDPKDFVSKVQTGLADFALTSTSENKFDTSQEVTWFISVTKIDDWTTEKFEYEYKTVHAGMTRKGKELGSPVRRYVQVSNSSTTIQGTTRPDWNFVTCLTFPSLFIVHAGSQDANYKATAGAHIFCRLDQEGCLARQVKKYTKGPTDDYLGNSVIRTLIFHKRATKTDEASTDWLQERVIRYSQLAASDKRVHTYILWQDITPKNSDYFFQDTQFSGGSWHNFKAVEAFDFLDRNEAISFLHQHRLNIVNSGDSEGLLVFGEPDLVI